MEGWQHPVLRRLCDGRDERKGTAFFFTSFFGSLLFGASSIF